MSPANLSYAMPANDGAGLPLSLSIFAERPRLRAMIGDDAQAVGFRIGAQTALADLLDGEMRPLGEIVVVDCPVVGAAELAALARLDMRAAHCGARLIVSTSMAALEDVFAALDQTNPPILIEPSRAAMG
jgi:hypothetical protein